MSGCEVQVAKPELVSTIMPVFEEEKAIGHGLDPSGERMEASGYLWRNPTCGRTLSLVAFNTEIHTERSHRVQMEET